MPTPYLCPLCNGFASLDRICPSCGTPLIHRGKVEEQYDPYSPYRNLEALKAADGYPDQMLHLCLHVGYCPHCNKEEIFFISEEPY